ncbi:MAG TPA: sugar ABC transporter permease [Thermoanaerobaculia bacterium]|nr:sugar ABC transporter permease [Thermoanaerobaculia bacterium]
MTAQPQLTVEEKRARLSGEHPATPPPDAGQPGPPLLHRVSVAVLLAALLGAGLLHWILVRSFKGATEERASRAAMIVARAAADVATAHGGEGEPLAAAMTAWQKEHKTVRAVRVANIDNRTIEASSFPEDLKEGEVPRRMQRPEKPLYDLGQELRANIEANVSEGNKREAEVSVERKPGGTLLIAAPIEKEGAVAGFAQVLSAPEIVSVSPPSPLFALAFALGPFVVIFALSFVWRGSNLLLVAIAALLLLVALFAYRQWAVKSLVDGAQEAEQRFAERVQREAEIVARVAPGAEANAKTWDADIHRTPLKVDPVQAVEGQKDAIAGAAYGISVLSLALLLFIGLGAAHRTGRALAQHRQAYSYIAPALLGMLFLVFFPFIYGFTLSFTGQTIYNVNQPLPEIWTGLQNYKEILGDFTVIKQTAGGGRAANYENFYYTLFFTIAWTVVNVAIGVTLGLLLALILNTKGLRGKTAYRVLLILPWAMPNFITALIWKGMFHRQFGVINHVLAIFGGTPVSWFEHPLTSFAAVVATNGWLSFPFMMVVSLGALQSISADLYEAARVDGASRWQQFTSITLPSLKPALIPAIILSVVWTFNMFNIIYLVSAGEPAHSTEILITQAYKLAFEQYRYGYASAYSVIIFGILLIYGVFQNRMTRATESIA